MQHQSAYIDLLKKVLCDYNRANEIEYKPLTAYPTLKNKVLRALDKFIRSKNYVICEINHTSAELRADGRDWPLNADSMIGLKRMDNIEYCIREAIKNKVEGDFIELGVWRGGASILMKALLNELKIKDRHVWLADSFEGLPKPDVNKYPADTDDKHFTFNELKVSIEEVKHNFEKYGLLDEQVKFLKGWFKDTLPTASINRIAVLRLDGDMYESTMDGLVNLYPKLSIGGYLIVDDWGAIPGCKKAVEDYRKEHNITERIIDIDWTGVFWQKEKE